MEDQKYESYKQNADGSCDWFVLRAKLQAEGNEVYPDKVKRRGLRKSNRHAPGKRPTPESLGLVPPDLRVTRHIRNGSDINKKD